ncbi:hypothetical protein Q8F55_005004 [Vanrija albida]|uniref:Helicase ATP-binding domain-containing protein n=1 Tax=Vanrija albida TaxID=181172 RepID=A0ABR3Q0E8_9TREE
MAPTSDYEFMETDEEDVLEALTPKEPKTRARRRSAAAAATPTRQSSKTPGSLAEQLFDDSGEETPRASSSRRHASRTATDRRSSRRPSAVLVEPSSPDPLALGSEADEHIASVRSISEYSWTPLRPTVIEVEIPFKPLSTLMGYQLAEDLQPPTSSSRRRLLARSEKEETTGRKVQRCPPPRTTKASVRNRAVETPSDELYSEEEVVELDESEGEASSDGVVGRVTRGAAAAPSWRTLRSDPKICEKCHQGPADEMLEKALKKKGKGKKRKQEDDWDFSEEERARLMMGWMECERCSVSWHWGCLKPNQRRDVLHAFRTKNPDAPRRKNIEIHESATFLCGNCETNPACYVCKHSRLPGEKHQELPSANPTTANGTADDEPIVIDDDDDDDGRGAGGSGSGKGDTAVATASAAPAESPDAQDVPVTDGFKPDGLRDSKPAPLLFREWNYLVDSIIAWRPWPAYAKEPELDEDELPLYRDPLPREYLVKFQGRSFRHVAWVPHPWLLSVAPAKLKNFLEKGPALNLITDETLASFGDTMEAPTIANVLEASEREKEPHGVPPDVEAAESLPVAWSTVDRVLDAMLLPPKGRKGKGKGKGKANGRVVVSDLESEESDWEPVDGQMPPVEKALEIERWENMAGRRLSEDDVDEVAPLVTWFLGKWDDLQYDQFDSELYPAFKHALKRYLAARRVKIPILNDQQIKARERLARTIGAPPNEQPECVVGGTLMPFQIEGFQWLTYKHLKRESCILADDMGLGKTIQVASFLGYLGSEDLQIYPALVIVPNSTITNWVREFEKWVPHLRVVPYYGVASSRKVVSQYELYHMGAQNKAAGLKAHVVLTTYDMITGNDFAVFSRMPRWEVVIVDEGQRLKSNSSLIFNRLKTLNSVHRVLLTGTPLNNNLRELFNLLNFLDPESFRHLEELEQRFNDLNESLILELHEMIKSYILRRIKADVLKLPPKVEIIVPISLTPAQKALNKRILHRHKEALNRIISTRKKKKMQAEKAKAKDAANGDRQPSGAPQANGSKDGETAAPAQNGEARRENSAGPSETAAERRRNQNALLPVVQPSEVVEVD